MKPVIVFDLRDAARHVRLDPAFGRIFGQSEASELCSSCSSPRRPFAGISG
jgi:hypothetical protein